MLRYVTLRPFTACIISGDTQAKWRLRGRRKRYQAREKEESLAQRGKKSAESRGAGAGSRKKFALAAHWREEPYKSDDRDRGTRKRVSFVSPGKTKYWSQKSVEKALVSRSLADCLYEKSASSSQQLRISAHRASRLNLM